MLRDMVHLSTTYYVCVTWNYVFLSILVGNIKKGERNVDVTMVPYFPSRQCILRDFIVLSMKVFQSRLFFLKRQCNAKFNFRCKHDHLKIVTCSSLKGGYQREIWTHEWQQNFLVCQNQRCIYFKIILNMHFKILIKF